MIHSNPDSEDALELDTMTLFETLGWQTTRAFNESFSPDKATVRKPYLGRTDQSQVVLRERLREAVARLNPDKFSVLQIEQINNFLT